jgi:hypothetical protein
MKSYGWFGLLLLIVSEYGLVRKIEPFHTWFYCFAWWSYILLADNLLLKLRGRSLLTGRRREFWGMLPLSVFIWLLFEAYNFRVQNWSYVTVPLPLWLRWFSYALSFSTVLPAVFITSDLVEPLFGGGSGKTASQCEPSTPSRPTRASAAFIAGGLALSAAPLIWPHYFFPAVWLGPIFLLDPLLGRAGIQSLSASIASGDRKRVWSLMLGGLVCGLLWEFWNYWALSKWTYTVPFFGEWKLFEMPVMGFGGFPPFALECWILYHGIRAIARRLNSFAARASWWLLLGVVSLFIFRGIDSRTMTRFGEKTSDENFNRSARPCVYASFL